MLGLLRDTMELIVNAASAGGIYADVRNEVNVRRFPLYGLPRDCRFSCCTGVSR
jgi:hypothetical protein